MELDTLGHSGVLAKPTQGRPERPDRGAPWRVRANGAGGLRRAADAGRSPWVLVAALALPLLGWALASLLFEPVHLALDAPRAQSSVEAATALARLFGALVLVLFPVAGAAGRLRWVAAGLVVLGLGALVFGSLQPLMADVPDLNTRVYASLVVWSIAGTFFAVGLLPDAPPRFTLRVAIAFLALFDVLAFAVINGTDALPTLVRLDGIDETGADGGTILRALTGWHWALGAVPLALVVAATVGAARHSSRADGDGDGDGLGRWLVAAMTLLAASQVHHLLWPSAYGPVLTTANLLRFAFAATVAVGAVLELRRVAAAHASLLAAEQDSRRRQADLAHLKDDFTSMVAHELATPVATIRGYARMLALGELGPAEHRRTVEAIEKETDLLQALVTDVETIATVERDDFVTYPFPVALDLILADAAAFARVLPGERAVTCPLDTGIRARADPERITQVLRNLLGNAAKYSPPGTPIEVRVARSAARVRVEVVDRGPGIPPDELARVFEKFGRGGDVRARGIAGHGLGLYLSRRIVRAHGGDLTVRSEAGAGSTFGFDLEVVA